MNVAEFFAKLGLKVDEGSFLKGSIALSGIRDGLSLVKSAAHAVEAAYQSFLGQLIASGDEAIKASQRYGVQVEALQELQYAFKLSGLSAEEAGTSLRFLARNAYDAATKGGEVAATFKRLGVNVKDAQGRLRPADDLLTELADKFAAMPDGVEKTALAVQLFGRSGSQLIPFLNAGSAGVEKLRTEARALGIVIDEETAKAAEALNDDLERLELAGKGLRTAIGAPLIRALAPVAEAMAHWAIANSKWIRTGITNAVKFFGTVLKAVWNTFKLLGELLLSKWGVGALALLAIGFFDVSAAAIASAASAVAAWVAATWPILAAVAAVALLILLFDDLQTFLEGGDSVIGRYAATIIKFFEELIPNAVDFWKEKISGFFDWLLDGIRNVGAQAWQSIKDMASQIPGASFVQEHVFGQSASPAADAAASSIISNTTGGNTTSFAPSININAQTGASAEDIGDKVRNALADFYDTRMRETAAAVGGG